MRAAGGRGPALRPLVGFNGALGVAVVVLLGLYLALSTGGFRSTGDSYQYLAAARSLHESGQLLGRTGLPYRAWGPLYPALLAVFASPLALRWLYGLALLGHLLLWSWAGRFLLPGRRAWTLPLALALSTAVLVPAKFIWSETVFVCLSAAYCAALAAWLRTGRGPWLGWATLAGFLLPLQRTSGTFLLLGAGVGLVAGGAWRARSRGQLVAHSIGCGAGVGGWFAYTAWVGTSSKYPPGNWLFSLNSLADFGFVLLRWFGPLAAGWRAALPAAGWALALAGVMALLWPPNRRGPAGLHTPVAAWQVFWWMAVANVLGHVLAVTLKLATAGTYDAERYLAAVAGPVLLLALARWPPAGPKRWRQVLNGLVLAAWLGYSALRVAHNVAELRSRPPQAWPRQGAASNGPRPTVGQPNADTPAPNIGPR